MSECFSEFYVYNGNVKLANEFVLPTDDSICIYEVLRVINRIPLFFEKHIERFINSLKITDIELTGAHELFKRDIRQLLDCNSADFGNIRYALYKTENRIERFAYFIKHSYPTAEMYEKGVKLKSLKILRPNPNAKVIHASIKEMVAKLLNDTLLYEIALVDDNGFITEGSRSNIFFIRRNSIYTAPENVVLQGITRNVVIDLIKNIGYSLHLQQVPEKEIGNYDAAFLTGTSPKVMGINCINEVNYDMKNNILSRLTEAFNIEIDLYIKRHKN